MNCQDFEAILVAYIDKTLDLEIQNEAREHILTCKTCAENILIYRNALAIIEDDYKITVSDKFHNEIMTKIESLDTAPSKSFFGRYIYYAAASVIFILSILSGYIIGNIYSENYLDKVYSEDIKNELFLEDSELLELNDY